MSIIKAKAYLKDVLAQRRCVPYTRYYGGIGRTGQAKEFGRSLGRWPQKSVNVVLGLLQNLEANANAKKGKKEEKKLHLASSLQGGKQDLLSDLALIYDQPIDSVDSTLLQLTDTLYRPLHYTLSLDSTRKKFTIRYQLPWPEDTYFKLIIGKRFAVDSSGVTLLKSDTVAFKTQKESEYGSLLFRLRNFDLKRHPVIQLVQSDKIVDSIAVTGPEISRPLYHPGDYEIRVLYDTNQNGTWDPGSFFGIHRQPEIVTQPQKPKIKVRGNGWENEYDVIL